MRLLFELHAKKVSFSEIAHNDDDEDDDE